MIVCVALAQGVGYAAPDVPDSEGHTPLMIVCGAKISGREQRTEAEIAVRDTAALRALLNAGADVNARSGAAAPVSGVTSLMYCAWRGSLAELQLLIDAGADVNAADSVGDTALMRAAQRGHAGMVRALLAAGASPNAQDKRGWTALMGACVSKNTADTGIAAMLVAAGTDIELKNHHGFTALSYAAQSNKKNHVELLLAAGADVNSRDTMGRNVLHRALMCRVSPDMVKCLLAAGAELRQIHPLGAQEDTFLFDAVYHRQPAEVIQWLIDAGAAVNASEILTASAYAVDARVQTVLLAAGADPNRGNPLNAVIHQWVDTSRARELILAGADVNRSIGATLCYADRREHLKLLLEHGADVNYRGGEGNTPFLVALRYGNLSCLNMLVEAGANPLARNDAGQNARDILAELSAVGPIATWAPPGRKANPPLGDLDFARLYRCLDAVKNAPEEQRAAAWKAAWER